MGLGRRSEVLEICEEELMRRLKKRADSEPLGEILDAVAGGEQSPYAAALDILRDEDRLVRILGEGRADNSDRKT